MKKTISIVAILIFTILLSACSGGGSAVEIKKAMQNAQIERITITNARYAGRYTIIDKKSMERFKGYIEKARIAKEDPGLEPDFVFELYDGTRSVGNFKYIAGVTDSSEANLIDMNGKLYRISRSIEDIFMKRLMKKNDLVNVPEYYISLISTIIKKHGMKEGSKVVADIGKDYSVTRSITSVDQKSILNSVSANKISVNFPTDSKNFDYSIEVKTGKYNNTSSEAVISVRDKEGKVTKYEVSGNYKSGDWEFHIKFK
ncbi:hypothetical protein [Clostridium cylindrosporum]|uniref:Lipoprotein n=1 Tax=Clostridium cylindrosporum DSM 605 TaxID=1121307 RepID=A0A0J8DFG0_CLOCY|nr:hypothetical protein [Clostridium cylindrosporum]KMT22918.1 hypothetical protein CLCY_5c01570 [Clostridium cylindrosporum DSM 605]